jgi:hypothetical protein
VSIRFLAQELYRLIRKVEELERALATIGEEVPLAERTRLEAELLKTRQEVEHYRMVIGSKKETP